MQSDEMRGMEIYNFAGKKIGTILYPVWRCKTKKIDGFAVLKNNFLQIKFYLPFSSVDRFEKGNIYLIKNYKTRRENMEIEPVKAIIGNSNAFVSKYDFNTETGSVKSVEIAKNIFEDVRNKRKIFTDFSVVNGLVKIHEEEEK